MAKKLVIRNKTSAELIELGFIGCENSSYCHKREQKLYTKNIILHETKNNQNEYFVEIPTSSIFTKQENAYENLYNFILENKDKDKSFWCQDKVLASGFEMKDVPNFYMDSKTGEIITSKEKRNLVKGLNLIKGLLTNDDRTHFPLSLEDTINPLIQLSEYIELVDLDLENNVDIDMER